MVVYDGVCIGGPRDGETVMSTNSDLSCAIYPSRQYWVQENAEAIVPADLAKYEFVKLMPSARDDVGRVVYTGAWVLSGIQDKLSYALAELIYNYRPKQGE